MIKIGEFAKICGVNIQTLRYYDKIGLLCADLIDDKNGYRYYKPEKIHVFQSISALKEMGFTLDEIRNLLAGTYEQRCGLYQKKKLELIESVRHTEEMIGKIDEACENAKLGSLPLNRQILELAFEDDPEVIGRWEYCGNLAARTKFEGEKYLDRRDCLPETLYFRPGGSPVWMYFWTKGTVYCMLEKYNVILPHSYRVFLHDSVKYMTVDWMEDRFDGDCNDDSLRIYRQADSRAYTEKETYRFRDNVNVPHLPDERVLGEWQTVDIIHEKAAFSLRRIKMRASDCGTNWLTGMKFYPRGMCVKIVNRSSGVSDIYHQYTEGAVIDEQREVAEKYEIISTHGEDYMILEHKSGDYSYTGKIYVYYVLRRKKE